MHKSIVGCTFSWARESWFYFIYKHTLLLLLDVRTTKTIA
jgi:hypothetical protein